MSEQEDRERRFAEYDASVKGATRPDGLDELVKELRAATTFDYDSGSSGYEQSADAMWKVALAAFNWAAGVVGATGFQASWAALKFYGEAMRVDGPFMVSKLEDALYPQCDLPGRLAEFIGSASSRTWLATEARRQIAKDDTAEFPAHPDVRAHWERLAALGDPR